MAAEREADWTGRRVIRWCGLAGGPILASCVLAFLPHQYMAIDGSVQPLAHPARATLAVAVWMAVWWMTEAIEIPATALLPAVAFPLLGVCDIDAALAPYADPLIFLFLGGFLLALAMQRWNLDRRVALSVLLAVGTRQDHMIAGFMLATAALSAFVSNTATTAMMLPIALSVVRLLEEQAAPSRNQSGENFPICLLLAIAYSASIGGMATITGTPTNAFLVAFLREQIAEAYRTEISFASWLLVGLPVTAVLLPATWWLLVRWVLPVDRTKISGGRKLVRLELEKLGPMQRGEWLTAAVFTCVATAWITRPLLARLTWHWDGEEVRLLAGLSDPVIAMAGAVCLFALPVRIARLEYVLDWKSTRNVPWGILLLFGGGLSLAQAVKNTGVDAFVGSLARHFTGLPDWLVIVLVTAVVVFLTEITSNTATAATLLPLLAALAPGLGIHPYLLAVPATIAASCAFMLPVATPPNAIVFGSGYIRMDHMLRAGWRLNLLSILVVSVMAGLLARLVLIR